MLCSNAFRASWDRTCSAVKLEHFTLVLSAYHLFLQPNHPNMLFPVLQANKQIQSDFCKMIATTMDYEYSGEL